MPKKTRYFVPDLSESSSQRKGDNYSHRTKTIVVFFPEQSQMKEKTGRKDLPTVRDIELEPGSLLWECLQAIEIENFVIDFF